MAPSSPRPPAENATLTLQVHDDDREELSTAARKYHRHPSRRDLCCVRFGRTRVLYSLSAQYGYFPMTAHVGPHWPFMLITYAVALGPLVMLFVGDRIHVGLRIALITSSVVTTVVFSLVACSDPGVVFQSYEPLAPANGDELPTGEQPSAVICAQCQLRRPKDASHCADCGVCVRKLDHHCPWTGKCIGRRTLMLFYLFLWAITIHLVIFGVGATVTYLRR
ncbi:hypothetical protein PINS_up023359 [Pythium insidiosum]|nr:hypothetical protein PINS_up023359 [Pythium insidiosum]